MDHGKLTDHNGKAVDFRNVILIMTTNAGAADLAKPAMGFSSSKREGDDTEAINRMFTPEFRNRLDAVDPVLRPAAGGHHQGRREVHLPARGAARRSRRHDRAVGGGDRWLAEKGYDEKFGARPLARVIQEHIKKPLADELLFGKLEHGGTVKVVVTGKGEDRKLSFDYPRRPIRRSGRKRKARRTRTTTTRSRRRCWSRPRRARRCRRRRSARSVRRRARAAPFPTCRAARTTSGNLAAEIGSAGDPLRRFFVSGSRCVPSVARFRSASIAIHGACGLAGRHRETARACNLGRRRTVAAECSNMGAARRSTLATATDAQP